ncbi:MAG: hypothetical protein MJK08_05315 [Campylobacterales bacterium]|nr:hypothetical protein [Campylobacterales bacterium]
MHSKILINKKYLQRLTLSFAAIAFLTSCGEEYQSKTNSTTKNIQNSFIKKDGLSGQVIAKSYIINAKVCFDVNSNGKCDNNEASEKTYKDGKFSFSKGDTYLGRYSNLLAEINNEYILSSSKNTNNIISPYTTIVVNEKIFNPYANNDTYTAISDLLENSTLFTESLLKGENYIASNPNTLDINTNNLVNSLKKSYLVNKNNNLNTIANLVDELIKTNNFIVNINSLKEHKRYDNLYKLENSGKILDIDSQDGNQRAISIEVDSNRTIVRSKWNNRLTLLDSNDNSKLMVKNYLDGNRGDGSSGASEKIITKLLLNFDQSSLYSIINDNQKSQSTHGLGLYKSNISKNSFDSLKYNSFENKNYFFHASFSDMVLNNANNKILLSSKENKIFIFDSSDFSMPLSIININSPSSSVAYSLDDKYFFTGNNTSVNIYSSTTNQIIKTHNFSKRIKKLLTINEKELLIIFNDSKEIKILDISNLNTTVVRSKLFEQDIDNISISPDKKNLSISFVKSKNIKSLLISKLSVSSSITLAKNINDFKFINNTKLIAISDFKAYYLNLNGDGLEPSSSEKTIWRNSYRK